MGLSHTQLCQTTRCSAPKTPILLCCWLAPPAPAVVHVCMLRALLQRTKTQAKTTDSRKRSKHPCRVRAWPPNTKETSCFEFPEANAKLAPGQTGHAYRELRKAQASSAELHECLDPTLQCIACTTLCLPIGATRVWSGASACVWHPAAAQPMSACFAPLTVRGASHTHSRRCRPCGRLTSQPAASSTQHPCRCRARNAWTMHTMRTHPADSITLENTHKHTHSVQSPHTQRKAG